MRAYSIVVDPNPEEGFTVTVEGVAGSSPAALTCVVDDNVVPAKNSYLVSGRSDRSSRVAGGSASRSSGSGVAKDPVSAEPSPAHSGPRVPVSVNDRCPFPGRPPVRTAEAPRHLEDAWCVHDGFYA